MDSDGDLDLVVGESNDTLVSYENTTPRGELITVNVTAENDAPTIAGLVTDVAVLEEVAFVVDLSAAEYGDADTSGNVSLTLTASSGVLSAPSIGSMTVTVTGAGAGALVLSGLASDIDDYLNFRTAIRYTSAQDVSGEDAAVITLSANDGAGDVTLGSVNVDIVPTVSDLYSPVTFSENTVNATPQLLDAGVSFADPTDGFDGGGTLSLTGLLAEDTVSVNDQGTGVGEIGFDGTTITYGGLAIGTLAGGGRVRSEYQLQCQCDLRGGRRAYPESNLCQQ